MLEYEGRVGSICAVYFTMSFLCEKSRGSSSKDKGFKLHFQRFPKPMIPFFIVGILPSTAVDEKVYSSG